MTQKLVMKSLCSHRQLIIAWRGVFTYSLMRQKHEEVLMKNMSFYEANFLLWINIFYPVHIKPISHAKMFCLHTLLQRKSHRLKLHMPLSWRKIKFKHMFMLCNRKHICENKYFSHIQTVVNWKHPIHFYLKKCLIKNSYITSQKSWST